MNKTSQCIKMLMYLNTGKVFKISELADEEHLNTNPRNIIAYKQELNKTWKSFSDNCGFVIESIPGKYGGYQINGHFKMPRITLSDIDKKVLFEGFKYLQSKKDFVNKAEYEKSFSKIMSNIELEDNSKNLLVVDKYQLSMNEENIKERYEFIEKAIKVKRQVELEYESLKNGLETIVVDPYKLFIYNNSWFFLAWSKDAGDVYYYKLNRIKSFKLLDQKFAVWKGFKAENYFDERGLKNNGTYHHVVLIAEGVRASLFKERVYGKNQTIEELEDGKVKVSLDMQNDGSIVSFALQCGSQIKILEPQWLIDKVKEEITKISDIYK